VARLEEFPRSAIEHASGGAVVQYRERILPLVFLHSVLEPGSSGSNEQQGPVPVVVFNDGDRSVGMVVDEILDVIEEAVKVRKKSGSEGLVGSAVVGGKVTDFLDFKAVIRASHGDWESSAAGLTIDKRVLIADASAFSRGLIRSGLDMAGYVVDEAARLDDALRSLERHPAQVVLAAMDLPANGATALLAAMRRRPEWEHIPVLALADSVSPAQASAALAAGFDDCQAKIDGDLMLESVAQFVAMSAAREAELVASEEEG
jgi:two-component system chemotaxis sensor kinase CheA